MAEKITGQMDIGVYGMAVMGSNLALNMADHGFKVAAYNRTGDLTEKVVKDHPHENMTPFYSLEDFIHALKKPRRVVLMVQAGKPVDMVIDSLLKVMEPGDVIIDGGNSFFKDTIRRTKFVEEHQLHYFGMGVSGGEKGARLGPALMPGGSAALYESIRPILESIAAHVDGEPCCTYIGTDGAGHYVKMVHNGIEYADMQLIAESYLLLKYLGGKTNEELSKIYHEWDGGELKSYLIGITADIFAEQDSAGGMVVDYIVDSAGQKGTGRWTSIQALEQGVNTAMITSACNARVMSNLLAEREKFARLIPSPKQSTSVGDIVEDVRRSLYTAKIVAYAQGFALYRAAGRDFGWDLDLGRIAAIFRGGCIIQAEFLGKITEAYRSQPNLENLMEAEFFLTKINANIESLRRIVAAAAGAGIPVPAMMNALAYIDASRATHLGANLIQAQRDYFGAHTFLRTDKEGSFHHEWKEHYGK